MEITQELKDLVIKEATNLKKFAHADELAYLDFDSLDPESKYRCIYGQMTGNCYSDRAHSLIMKCAERVCVASKVCGGKLATSINGAPYPVTGQDRGDQYFSPIETFIDIAGRDSVKNQALIAFLKGETETLEL